MGSIAVDSSAASWGAGAIASAEDQAAESDPVANNPIVDTTAGDPSDGIDEMEATPGDAIDGTGSSNEAELGDEADGVDEPDGDASAREAKSFDEQLDEILAGVERPKFDAGTEARLAGLDPEVRDAAIAHLELLEILGFDPRIGRDGGNRTYDRQDELYAQGRTAPGNAVTNAQGGESFHNFGAAYDVTLYTNGQPIQNGDDPAYQTSGVIGKSQGMEWGGDWHHPDMPHFQRTDGQSEAEMRARYEAGQSIHPDK